MTIICDKCERKHLELCPNCGQEAKFVQLSFACVNPTCPVTRFQEGAGGVKYKTCADCSRRGREVDNEGFYKQDNEQIWRVK